MGAPRDRASELPNQLFINPEECICCALCAPECPWEAIHDLDAVPTAFSDDIALNALSATRPDEFHVPATRLVARPSLGEVRANERRWLECDELRVGDAQSTPPAPDSDLRGER